MRPSQTFNDIIATERLQASGPNPPDILVSNGGYALLGPLVSAGLLLPLDDYGVRKGFARAYGRDVLPRPKELATQGERWRPYRTAASWYLWRATELEVS